MTPNEVRAALDGHLKTSCSTTPIAWVNLPFDPPKDAVDGSGNPVPWLRATFKPGQAVPDEMGEQGQGHRSGVYILQVFGPEGEGPGAVLDLSGQLEALFRRKTLSGVECGEPYSTDPKEDAGGGPWFQCNVIVPWWAWVGE
jgi:hypothetical protein